MNKKALRIKIINIRNNMDIQSKTIYDDLIIQKLINSHYFKESKNIFMYLGYSSEIDTKKYVKQFVDLGKNIYVPRTDIENKTMEAVKIVDLTNLKEDKYGILEPTKDIEAMNKNELDLVIMPGLAFDTNGGRLGYGGGYYDKYLQKIAGNLSKVALAYDFQIVQEVPKEEHDIKVDYIITEKREIEC